MTPDEIKLMAVVMGLCTVFLVALGVGIYCFVRKLERLDREKLQQEGLPPDE